MKHFIILTLIVASTCTFAQEALQDGFFRNKDFSAVEPTPYPEIRPLDILYVKRIWRDIDTNHDENKFFGEPNSRLIDVLIDAIRSESIIAYSAINTLKNPSSDAFTEPLSSQEALEKFVGDSVLVPVFDKEGNQVSVKYLPGEFYADRITKFRIKEDWLFDKVRGIYEVRIVGLAPLTKIIALGEVITEQPLFWINFNQSRNSLTHTEVIMNGQSSGLTYDDIFTLRKFKSIIIKESNPNNLKISDYVKTAEEAEKEAQRIENSLRTRKQSIFLSTTND